MQEAFTLVEFSKDTEFLAIVENNRLLYISKFIKNLGNNSESQEDLDYLLSVLEEKQLEEVAVSTARKYQEIKKSKLDTTILDYLYYKELGFELYIYNKYPDYRAIKEIYYFPEIAGPVYFSRVIYQIYILTAVDKEEDNRSEDSEDTETEVDKKLRKV